MIEQSLSMPLRQSMKHSMKYHEELKIVNHKPMHLRKQKNMGMPRGLIKLTKAVNKAQAWKDWGTLAASAPPALVKKYQPPTNASTAKIDKAIYALRKEMSLRKFMPGKDWLKENKNAKDL